MYHTQREYLVELGMKDKLLDYLTENQISQLAEYGLDHHNHPDLLKILISLASLERRGRVGTIELVASGIITPLQAKNLSKEQIIEILELYHTAENDDDFNARNARALATAHIVENQQNKVFKETGERIIGTYDRYSENQHHDEYY